MKYSGAIVKTVTYLAWGPDHTANTVYLDTAGMFDAFNDSYFYGDEWGHASKVILAEGAWREY